MSANESINKRIETRNYKVTAKAAALGVGDPPDTSIAHAEEVNARLISLRAKLHKKGVLPAADMSIGNTAKKIVVDQAQEEIQDTDPNDEDFSSDDFTIDEKDVSSVSSAPLKPGSISARLDTVFAELEKNENPK